MFARRFLQSFAQLKRVLTVHNNVNRAVLGFAPQRQFHQSKHSFCKSRIVGPSSYGLDIEIPNNKSYVEYLLDKCDLYGDRDAICDGITGRKFSYRQLSELTKKAASVLKRMGIEQQDIIAIHLPNVIEYAPVFFGIQAAGNIAMPVNTLFNADEIAYQLQDGGAKYILSSSPLINAAREGAAKANIPPDNVIDLSSFWDLVLKDAASHLTHIHSTDNPSDEIMCLPYSSGTTGRPKGVMLTHINCIAHAILFGNRKFMPEIADGQQRIVMALLPFFHVYGLFLILGMYVHLGSKLVCMQEFDPEMFLKVTEQEKLTDLSLVPPLALFLAKHPMVDKYDLSSVENMICGAAPLAKEVEELLWKRFPHVKSIRQGYGMTELTAACTFNPPEKIKSGSVGLLLPNIEGMVVDSETGQPLGPGEQGEICFRGPILFKGYLNKPEVTAETIDKDGWLHTGDIGHYDEDHYFYIADRKKELIKYKGFQVPPADLEAVLVSNPDVADAAVVGVPDGKGDEVPKAFVVPKGDITEQQVQDYVASKVAPYKKLRGGVTFVDVIPKSPSGKILRRVIREKITTKTK